MNDRTSDIVCNDKLQHIEQTLISTVFQLELVSESIDLHSIALKSRILSSIDALNALLRDIDT